MSLHRYDCGVTRQLWQVWWYCAGPCFGRLAVHNVATSETKAIPVSQKMPAVVVMAQVAALPCPALPVPSKSDFCASAQLARVFCPHTCPPGVERVLGITLHHAAGRALVSPYGCWGAGHSRGRLDRPQGRVCQDLERVLSQPCVPAIQSHAHRHQVEALRDRHSIHAGSQCIQMSLLPLQMPSVALQHVPNQLACTTTSFLRSRPCDKFIPPCQARSDARHCHAEIVVPAGVSHWMMTATHGWAARPAM